jgi:multidrug efflux pump subunit AcrA (membrane-fusion protein)
MDFRRKALDSLRAPDDLDSPVRLARPQAWVALLVLAAVMSAGVVWCCFGKVPRSVSGTGILTHPLGISALQGPYSGEIGNIFTQADSIVPAGTPVISIVSPTGGTQLVRTPFAGIVTSVLVTSGEYVTPGTTLLDIERTDAPNDRLLARVYVPASQAVDLQPGDEVSLNVSSAPAQAFGVLRGRITSVDAFPESREQVLDFLGGNTLLGNRFLGNGAPIAVTVDLSADQATVSGFRWSTKTGPPFQLESQTLVTADISLPGERPITWVLPG